MSRPKPSPIAGVAGVAGLVALVGVTAPLSAAATATFQVVVSDAWAAGVSPDGSTVVGTYFGDHPVGYATAYRWKEGVFTEIPTSVFPGGEGLAASYDGSIYVGYTDRQAFRWENGQTTPLGTLGGYPYSTSSASDVSWDGARIVGNSDGSGFIHQNGVMSPIPFSVYAVSGDGQVVVGYRSNGTTGDYEAMRWQNGSATGLGDLQGGPSLLSQARDVNYDGSVIVGFGSQNPGGYYTEAVRWQNGEISGLGSPSGTSSSVAHAVSDDGSIVVGEAQIIYPNGYEDVAAIWDVAGAHVLEDLLVQTHGLDLAAYDLTRALGISADGRTIVGEGSQHLDDGSQVAIAWMAVIPEPGTGALVTLGLVALGGGRRRR